MAPRGWMCGMVWWNVTNEGSQEEQEVMNWVRSLHMRACTGQIIWTLSLLGGIQSYWIWLDFEGSMVFCLVSLRYHRQKISWQSAAICLQFINDLHCLVSILIGHLGRLGSFVRLNYNDLIFELTQSSVKCTWLLIHNESFNHRMNSEWSGGEFTAWIKMHSRKRPWIEMQQFMMTGITLIGFALDVLKHDCCD